MSYIYGMQRANGDWFALNDHGRLRVPLFHSSHDGTMARLRNLGMRLFKPVLLDTSGLNSLLPMGGGSDVDFCLVKDPFAGLDQGSLLERAELARLVRRPVEMPAKSRDDGAAVTRRPIHQSEWWN